MKYFFFIFFNLYVINAYTLDLVPLKKYIEQNDINNNESKSYEFYARCSALFAYTSSLMKSPKMSEMKKNFSMLSNIYYLKMSKLSISTKKNDINKEKLKLYLNYYNELGNKNFISVGEYLTDLHFNDTKVCSDFSKKEF